MGYMAKCPARIFNGIHSLAPPWNGVYKIFLIPLIIIRLQNVSDESVSPSVQRAPLGT